MFTLLVKFCILDVFEYLMCAVRLNRCVMSVEMGTFHFFKISFIHRSWTNHFVRFFNRSQKLSKIIRSVNSFLFKNSFEKIFFHFSTRSILFRQSFSFFLNDAIFHEKYLCIPTDWGRRNNDEDICVYLLIEEEGMMMKISVYTYWLRKKE